MIDFEKDVFKGTLALNIDGSHEVRIVVSEAFEPLYVGIDICRLLDYDAPTKLFSRYAKGNWQVYDVQFVAYTGKRGTTKTRCVSRDQAEKMLHDLRAAKTVKDLLRQKVYPTGEAFAEWRRRNAIKDPSGIQTQRAVQVYRDDSISVRYIAQELDRIIFSCLEMKRQIGSINA